MAVTEADVLGVFTQVAAIKNADQFLIITANQDSTVSATKITAELVRAYLNEGFTLTVGDDGYLYIGGVKTQAVVEGITPQLERRSDGIYCSSDNGETWECVAYFSDFSKFLKVAQTSTTVQVSPNVQNVWGSSVSSLTVSFASGETGQMNEYLLEFTPSTSNFSLTFVSSPSVTWMEEPRWQSGKTYQVSIIDRVATFKAAGEERLEAITDTEFNAIFD